MGGYYEAPTSSSSRRTQQALYYLGGNVDSPQSLARLPTIRCVVLKFSKRPLGACAQEIGKKKVTEWEGLGTEYWKQEGCWSSTSVDADGRAPCRCCPLTRAPLWDKSPWETSRTSPSMARCPLPPSSFPSCTHARGGTLLRTLHDQVTRGPGSHYCVPQPNERELKSSSTSHHRCRQSLEGPPPCPSWHRLLLGLCSRARARSPLPRAPSCPAFWSAPALRAPLPTPPPQSRG